jgi:hypothetical protein
VNEQILRDGDRSVRTLIYAAQNVVGSIQPEGAGDDFDRALGILSPSTDVTEGRAKVRSVFSGLAERLTTLRRDRIRDLPPKKWTGLGRFALGVGWADIAQS